MKVKSSVAYAALLAAGILVPSAQAQTTGGGLVGTPPGFASAARTVTATATVAAIDMATRKVTLRRADGTTFDVVAGDQVRNLPQLRVGDQVSLEFLDTLTLELKKGGTGLPASRSDAVAVARAELGARPGGAVTRETTIVADVVAVDAASRTVSLRGPTGNVVVLPVRDPEQFKVIAVGDQIEATYVEAVAVSVTPVAAPVAMAPPRPEYRAFLFLWGSGVDGDITTRDPRNAAQQVRVSFDWDFGDIWDNLDAAFMIYGDARFGRWSVFGDYTYTKLSPSRDLGGVLFDRADTTLKTQFGQLAAGYALWEDPANRANRFELYGGARYYSTRYDVIFRSGPNDFESDANDDWWDGIIGVRAFWQLAPRWVAVGQLDGGWGGSDHSIHVWGYVGYQFDWGSAGLGWRYLNFKRDHHGVTNDLSYNGPLLGVAMKF